MGETEAVDQVASGSMCGFALHFHREGSKHMRRRQCVLWGVVVCLLVGLAAGVLGQQVGDATRGEQIYQILCWTCHGKYGRGELVAITAVRGKTGDFTDYAYMSALSDEDLYDRVQGKGPGGAKSVHGKLWAYAITEEALWDLVAYIRTLSGPGLRGSLMAGRDKYEDYCVVCHGATGKGDGPVALNLQPAPTDFTDPSVMAELTDKALFEGIRRGGGAIHRSIYMPRWREQLTDEDIWDLVEYVKRFKPS